MTPSLQGSPTKTKETPSLHQLRLAPLDTNPVFQCLGRIINHKHCKVVIPNEKINKNHMALKANHSKKINKNTKIIQQKSINIKMILC